MIPQFELYSIYDRIKGMKTKKRNPLICAVLAFAIPVVILFVICLIYGFYPFGDKSILMADMRFQFVDYFACYRRILFGNEDCFYTLSKTFGGDMAGLLAYYCNTPLLFLLAFVENRALPGGILLIAVFMTGLCGLNFNIFLNRSFGFRWSSLIFSVAYAFTGYLMGYFNCVHYFFAVALLPLVMYGLLDIIRREKVSVFYILILALTIFSSYYLGYMICLFTVLFFFYIFFTSYRTVSAIKEHFRAFLIYVLSSVTAAGLSSVSLLCALFSLQGQKSSGVSISLRLLFDPLEFFSGLYTGAFHGNISDGLPLIYSGVTAATLLVLFYLNRRISLREKVCSAIVFAILFLSFIFDSLNVIWHGFAHPIGFPHRFSFLFSFFLLYIAYTCFIYIQGAFKRKDYIIVLALFLCYSAFLLLRHSEYVGIREAAVSFVVMASVLSSVYLCQYGKQYMLPVLLGMVFISSMDAGYNAYVSIGSYFPELSSTDDYDMALYREFIDETGGIVSELKKNEGLYRMEKLYRRSLNDAMMLGYNGLSHFSSCETNDIKSFMGEMGFRNNENWAYYGEEGSTTFADAFMGVRYIISQYDEIPRPYERIMERYDKYVFENPYALPFGFMMTGEAQELSYEGHDHFTWQNAIASAFDGHERKLYRPVSGVSIKTENLAVNGNTYTKENAEAEAYIEYDFIADSGDTIFMYFDAPDFQDARIIVNGLEKQPYFTQYGWNIRGLGIYKEGEPVALRIYPEGNELTIDGYEFYYEDREAVKDWYGSVTGGELRLESSSKLSGSISSDTSDGLLVFSLPFDENWRILVDGERAEAVKALDGLLSVRIGEGEHTFRLKYVPKGVRLGIPVMLISICTLLLIIFKSRKNSSI